MAHFRPHPRRTIQLLRKDSARPNRRSPDSVPSTHPYFYDPALGVTDVGKLEFNSCVIEDDVWISRDVTITPGCRLVGRGLSSAPEPWSPRTYRYSVMVGAPARLLRMHFDDGLIAAIEKTEWWEMDKETLTKRLRQNPDAFYRPTPPNVAFIAAATER